MGGTCGDGKLEYINYKEPSGHEWDFMATLNKREIFELAERWMMPSKELIKRRHQLRKKARKVVAVFP